MQVVRTPPAVVRVVAGPVVAVHVTTPVVKVVRPDSAVVRVAVAKPVVAVTGVGLQGPPGPPGAPTRQSLTAQVDGTNTNFATGAFTPGTTQLYLNGLLLDTAHYIEAVGSVILSDAPLVGDSLTIVFIAS